MNKITKIELKSLAILKAQLTILSYFVFQAVSIPVAIYIYGATLTAQAIFYSMAVTLPLAIVFSAANAIVIAAMYNNGLLYPVNGEIEIVVSTEQELVDRDNIEIIRF